MAYSTPAMVRKALVPTSSGSLPTSVTNTGADLADDQISDLIAEADALIDSYLRRYYLTPVATIDDGAGNQVVPHPLDYWSRNIAAYSATLVVKRSQDLSPQDPISLRYAATMQALQQVATGRAALDLPGNTADNANVGVGTGISPYVGDLFTVDEFDLRPPYNPLPGRWWP